MVINVDDWVELKNGWIVLVVNRPDRETQVVDVYDPVTQKPHQVALSEIKRGFIG